MGLSISHDALNWGSDGIYGWNSRIKTPLDFDLVNTSGGATVTLWANAGPSGTGGTGFPALFQLINSSGNALVRVGMNQGFGWNNGCPIGFGVNGGDKNVARNNFWDTGGAWQFIAGVNEDASDHLQGSISFYEGDESRQASTVTPNFGSADGPSSGSGAPDSAEGVDVGFLYNASFNRRSGGNIAFARFDFRPLSLDEVRRIQHDPFYAADVWPCYIFLPGLDGNSLIRDYGPWSNAVAEFSPTSALSQRPSVGASPSVIPERALALARRAELKRQIQPFLIPAASNGIFGVGSGSTSSTGTGAGSVSVTGSGSVSVSASGAGAGSVEITAAGTGSTSSAGSGAGTLGSSPITGTGSGSTSSTSSGAGGLAISGSGSGSTDSASAANANLAITSTGSGSTDSTGTGAGTSTPPDITGTGTGSTSSTSASTAKLTIIASGSGSTQADSAATGALSVSGAGAGQASAFSAATGQLQLVASGSGQVSATGAGFGQDLSASSTPAERICSVDAENRTLDIPEETRTLRAS